MLARVLLITIGAAQTASTGQPSRVLHLEDAVRTALQHQPTLIQAQAATRAAGAREFYARAPLLPQVTATAGYMHGYGGFGGGTRSSGGTGGTTNSSGSVGASTTPSGGVTAGFAGTYDLFSVGAGATQLIWDFGQAARKWQAASRFTESAQASEQSVAVQVAFNARRAFFLVRAQKSLLRVAQDTLANQEKHLGQVQGFVSVGTRPEIDLAQAKSDVATSRVQVINAQNAYDLSKVQLNQAMGVFGATDFDVADEVIAEMPEEEFPIDRLVQSAESKRPELQTLVKQREAEELTARALKGAYGPTLSATAGASAVGPAPDALSPNWNVGAALVWPLFQGGLTTGQVREAEANMDAASAQLESERLQVRLDVQQAVLGIHAAKASIGAARDAVANARDRLRLAEGRYESGVGNIIELGDAQVALADASSQFVQAEFNLATARAQLLSALGQR